MRRFTPESRNTLIVERMVSLSQPQPAIVGEPSAITSFLSPFTIMYRLSFSMSSPIGSSTMVSYSPLLAMSNSPSISDHVEIFATSILIPRRPKYFAPFSQSTSNGFGAVDENVVFPTPPFPYTIITIDGFSCGSVLFVIFMI